MVRTLYFLVLGFTGLFAIQGCGGGAPPAVETTAAADETSAAQDTRKICNLGKPYRLNQIEYD